MNREQKYVHFRKLKSQIQKKYKTAKTVSRNGKFCVEHEGRNLIQNYPSLAMADSVYDAWKNASIVLHWDKIDTRNSRTLRNDLSAVTVIDEVKKAADKDRTIDKERKVKKDDESLFEREDYSLDRMEDWS
jgi:hypothetical protein|tara:strand:+ start:368 stop:760 length:393 start_codon:yes stop_codon:yes gene_type:complete